MARLYRRGNWSCMARRLALAALLACVSVAHAASPPRQLVHWNEMAKPAVLPDGTVVAYFLEHEGPGLAPTPDEQAMTARESPDRGATWGEPRRLFTLPREEGGFGYFVALVDGGGEVHFFVLCDANTGAIRSRPQSHPRGPVEPLAAQRLDIWHVRSTEARTKWTTPRRIWQGRAGDLQSVTQLRGGRIVLPVCYYVNRGWGNRGTGADEFTYTGQFDTTVLYSDDRGATWQTSPSVLRTPTPDLASYGAVEPVVIERTDGRVWMLLRTQLGRFYESSSADGSRWSPAKPSKIVSSDSPAALLRLPNGRMLMLWNLCARHPYAQGSRHVLHAALSSDDGRNWTGVREIMRDPHRDEPPPTSGDHGVSYPFAVCGRDGLVYYSLWVQTGRGRTLECLDPAWLDETSQRDDFNDGLAAWSTFGTRGVATAAGLRGASGLALTISKPERDWPAAAVRNFPQGKKGRLAMRLLRESGAAGMNLELTDHFSPPFDAESDLHAVFQVAIDPEGKFGGSKSLEPGHWSLLELSWDGDRGTCLVSLDGTEVATAKARRESPGPCYVRLRAMSDEPSAKRLCVDWLEVDVSPSAAERRGVK